MINYLKRNEEMINSVQSRGVQNSQKLGVSSAKGEQPVLRVFNATFAQVAAEKAGGSKAPRGFKALTVTDIIKLWLRDTLKSIKK
jgi:hypothetical protein